MVCAVRVASFCAAVLPALGSGDSFELMEDCFFDRALAMLQKTAALVGVPGLVGASEQASFGPGAPLLRSLVVPLQRVGVQRHDGFLASLFAEAVDQSSFYVGQVSLGSPGQPLKVIFDTSSIISWVRHSTCNSKACKTHKRFAPRKSSSAIDVNYHGDAMSKEHRLVDAKLPHEGIEMQYWQSDLGDGNISARFVRDNLCLGRASEGEACVDMVLAAAVKLDDEPFRSMPGDGIIGLGLEGQGEANSPMSSFLGRLFQASGNVLPQFGIWLGKDGGELHLGGHELADLAGPLTWSPVHRPEDGYWQAAILSVRVGDALVNDCSKGCHAIVDTGVSHLGVQAGLLPSLREKLLPERASDGSCTGPDLMFDMGDATLTLRASEYAGDDCVPKLGSLDLGEDEGYNGVFTFGAVVLQRYYAAFDWKQQRVGFALLSDSPIPAGADAPRSMVGALVV